IPQRHDRLATPPVVAQLVDDEAELVGDALAVGAPEVPVGLEKLLEARGDPDQPVRVGEPTDQLDRLGGRDARVESSAAASRQREQRRLDVDRVVLQCVRQSVAGRAALATAAEVLEDLGVDVATVATVDESGHVPRSSCLVSASAIRLPY